MKVNYDFHCKQFQITHQVTLSPGENDLPDEIAIALIAGSDALVASVADAKKKREAKAAGKEATPATDTEVEAARASMKGKGLCSACVTPALLPKKKKEVRDNA